MNSEIVSVEWLNAHLEDENIVLLDASPASTVTGTSSTVSEWCIPNSRPFDIKGKFTDKESPFPNTVPSPQQFEQECQALGINKTSKIIVYDNLGIYTSPRAWWLFKVMGHEAVSVLDGGLPEWVKMGHDTVPKSDLKHDFESGDFESRFLQKYVISYDDVIRNIKSNSFQIVDARSEGRFLGLEKEPRKHLKSGSIPNSVNIPFKDLIVNGKFRSRDELKSIFEQKLQSVDQLVFSCGSGLTACIVMLACEIAFERSLYLYDGSWTEYAELQNLRTEID